MRTPPRVGLARRSRAGWDPRPAVGAPGAGGHRTSQRDARRRAAPRRRARRPAATPRVRGARPPSPAPLGVADAVAPVEHERRPAARPSTAAAPPSWSACAWVTTSRSSRRTPAARRRASDGAVGRPGVDEDRACAVLDQRRVALADVEERDPQPRRRGEPGAPACATARAPSASARTAPRTDAPAALCAATTRERPRPAHAAPTSHAGGARLRAGQARRRRARRHTTYASGQPGERDEAARPAPGRPGPAPRRASPATSPARPPAPPARWRAATTSDACPKCSAMSGAVPSVAATVSAVASARRARQPAPQPAPSRTRRGRARGWPTTAAKLSCQPTSSVARGLSASVTAAASSSACQRAAGPARERGDDAGGAHHPRPLDRRPAARERARRARSAARTSASRTRRPRPSAARRPSTRAASSIDVLPAGGDQVREARGPELVARAVGERRVVAERHAAQQGALRRRDARSAATRLRPRAHARRRRPASPPRRAPVSVSASARSCGVHAARALPGVGGGQRLEPSARRRAALPPASVGQRTPRAGAQQDPLAVEPDGGDPCAERPAIAARRGARRARGPRGRAVARGAVASSACRRAWASSAPARTAPTSASAHRRARGERRRRARGERAPRAARAGRRGARRRPRPCPRARAGRAARRRAVAHGSQLDLRSAARPGASGRCRGSRRGRRSSESRRAGGASRGSSAAVAGPTPSSVSSCSAVARVEADRRLRRGRRGSRRRRPAAAPAAPRRGTTTCWPSATFAARLIALRSAPARGPPARRDGVLDALALAQPVDPGAAHRAGDVDERDRRGCLGSMRTAADPGPPRARSPPARGARPRAALRAWPCMKRTPSASDDERREGVGDELWAGDGGHAPRLGLVA